MLNRHLSIKTKSRRMLEPQISKPPKVLDLNIFKIAVADCIRTSLGPRGMDKMIKDGRG